MPSPLSPIHFVSYGEIFVIFPPAASNGPTSPPAFCSSWIVFGRIRFPTIAMSITLCSPSVTLLQVDLGPLVQWLCDAWRKRKTRRRERKLAVEATRQRERL